MNLPVLLFFGIFIGIYGLANFYIGLRVWQFTGAYIPYLNGRVYWVSFWILATCYIWGRITKKFLPDPISNAVIWTGSYWMAAMLYLVIAFLFVDIVMGMDRFLHFIHGGVKQSPWFLPAIGVGVIVLVLGTLVYGTWNARNPRITSYEINIDKKAGDVKTLHIAMASDLHLGNIVGNQRLLKMVDMVNGLQPDVVLLAGDIIDEDNKPFQQQNMGDTFRKLKSRYGVYGVLGNHEYYGGDLGTTVQYLEAAGIKILRDERVRVADSFYIVGREDRAYERSGRERKSLEALLQGIDRSLPLLLMDHQPYHLEEAEGQGVDIQFSGHTHQGQMFPNNLITARMYEKDWGHLIKNNLHVIVSCGFGTWGPPIRTGSRPEVVDIVVHFK